MSSWVVLLLSLLIRNFVVLLVLGTFVVLILSTLLVLVVLLILVVLVVIYIRGSLLCVECSVSREGMKGR